MAKANSTRKTSSAETRSALERMSIELNGFGALLAGVEEICRIEDIGGDALNVAANTYRRINKSLCKTAETLHGMAKNCGAE